MLRRQRFVCSFAALLALATAGACVQAPEEEAAKQPPPVGSRAKRNVDPSMTATGMQAPAATATSAGTQVATAMSAASGGGTLLPDAGDAQDLDAGPSSAGSGASAGSVAAGSGGSSGSAAAGRGGRGGAGGMRAAGAGGRGGAGGAGGQAGGASEACMNQLCFTLVDCWLLSVADCGYTACDNFICK